MKKVIIFGLFFIGVFISNAQERCDTLKWKTIKTIYGYSAMPGGYFYEKDILDSAVINIDTLSFFYPRITAVNISNDTFYSNTKFSIFADIYVFTDTGLVYNPWGVIGYYWKLDEFPNDTVNAIVWIKIDLLDIINQIKEEKGVELEEINYWQMIIGVSHTERNGVYSDSVFYAGADTSIFYIVRTPVGIVETNNYASLRSVFPNPAQTHFTVTNTENASLQLYNMLGQEVWRAYSTEVETHCNASLQQGLYVLKVVKNGVVSTHKVVVRD